MDGGAVCSAVDLSDGGRRSPGASCSVDADLADLSLSDAPKAAPEKPDDRLLAAALADSPELIAQALSSGATNIDAAMTIALDSGCAAALYMLLQRGALARTIGVMPSLLHRPGVRLDQRVNSAALLIEHISTAHSAAAYRASVHDVLLAGACLREGALILADLVAAGHLEAAFPNDGQREKALLEARKLAVSARRVSWSSGGSQDAVVCGLVRTTIRRRYSGYELARQQIQLCIDGLNTVAWSPARHRCYPPPFRQLVRQVLLIARRPPLSQLDEDSLHLVLAHLARLHFWVAPSLDLDEGEEIDFRSRRLSRTVVDTECAARDREAQRQAAQPTKTKYVERLHRFVQARSERKATPVHQASYYAGR